MKRSVLLMAMIACCTSAYGEFRLVGYQADRDHCDRWSDNVGLAAKYKQRGTSFQQLTELAEETFPPKGRFLFMDAANFAYFDPRVKMLTPTRAQDVAYDICMKRAKASE